MSMSGMPPADRLSLPLQAAVPGAEEEEADANLRGSVASDAADDDLPIFDRVAQWPQAYKSYLVEGFEHDCALGDGLIGGPDASLGRRIAGTAGKVTVVAVGGVARAVGLAKLAQWAASAALGFARWVVGGCVSFARFLGGIVATEVVEKAIGPRNQVQRAVENIARQTNDLVGDPNAPEEHRNGARLGQAYLRGELGPHFAEQLRKAYGSPAFQQAMGDSVRDARGAVVKQALEDAKPYAYAGLAAGVVAAAVALYSGNVNEIASTIVVSGAAATAAAAGYYYVSASLSEVADSVAGWFDQDFFSVPDEYWE